MTNCPRFYWQEGRKEFYRGSVSEITPVTRYPTRGEKVFQALFSGVPYQFGRSTTVLRIRLEEHVPDMSRFPERTVTLEYPSDADGELIYGDDITVEAATRGGKRIAKKIWVNENDARRRVGASMEIPAWMIRVVVLFMTLMLAGAVLTIIGLVSGVVSFVNSPAFSELAATCVAAGIILAAIVSCFRTGRR